MTPDEIIRQAAEMLGQRTRWATQAEVDEALRRWRAEPQAPLRGAIDYRRRPDGVWEMPK